ncbi:MAG: hypothetical protein LRY53_08075 [Burkholderiaceae bacterium]|nr:hypothetical protein [Burkholderiaceae bacterium]MCD8517627.1 hypothetical protein [Burkholderiaceae bacterium]MCD8537420.1 hypothetical protein [Burkholderiaceae bacterium]MCD8565579.1 hypothetical protein [Burkholderiaceae bacterium]
MENQMIESTSAMPAVINHSPLDMADEVAREHEEFTVKYVVGGRLALYDLLGKMLATVQQFLSSADREQLIEEVRASLHGLGIKTQRNTSDIALLVRYMTRTDRKATHVYTRAIEAALENGVAVDGMRDFIDGSGGIEKIRASRAVDAQGNVSHSYSAVDYEAIAEEYLSLKTYVPMGKFDASPAFDSFRSNSAAFEYFVCTRRIDGYHILAKLPPTAEFERVAIRYLAQTMASDPDGTAKGMSKLRAAVAEVKQQKMADITAAINAAD